MTRGGARMNVVDYVIANARNRPGHPAVEDGERVFTYALLAAMVDCAATSLAARKIGRGHVVLVALTDSAEHIATLLALASIGAVSYSIDPRLSGEQCRKEATGLTIATAIVATDGGGFEDYPAYPLASLFQGFDPASPAFAPMREPLALDANAPLMITQSSGTTGDPKRLILTHHQMVERNQRSLAALGLTASERYLQVPYLYFFSGRRRCFKMLMLGATVVLNHATSSEEFARNFSERGITYTFLTPYHLRSLLRSAKGDAPAWPHLKIIMGSAPSSDDDKRLARQKLTPQVFDTYGTNEIGTATVLTPADQDRYPDSIGRLIDGIEAQVVDDNDQPLPHGEIGEIGFRGPFLSTEYLNNAAATARHFRNGWIYPGDLATINAEGFVFLKGRTDDVINNSGVKYFPSEVEAVLRQHPSVREVAVIGGMDPKLGEVTVAFVVRSDSVNYKELLKHCEGKIAMYKAPRWVFFIDQIPKVPPDKPDRKALKEIFRRRLAGKPAPA
jgi:acyl-CoA synthetase (AMP-forming)/AMP-acid ligase II